MFMLFLMSMISRLFAVRLCSSVVSLFTVGHVRCFIYYLGELMGLIAFPYPSIVYEAMFLRAVVGLAAAATKMLNWCINCVLMRVMERRERDNS